MTAAIGVAIGLGLLGLALLATILTWITLAFLGLIEKQAEPKSTER